MERTSDYAEDFYTGGDVRTFPEQPTDPSLLSGTGDVVDDIDSFLTPDVLSRRQSNERTSLDDPDDGEQEYEDEQCIQVAPQHYVDSIHQRDRPIPWMRS